MCLLFLDGQQQHVVLDTAKALTDHVITRQQLLQELGLLVLHRLDDELVVAGEVEPGAAGSRVGQLNQGLVADGVLQFRVTILAPSSLVTLSRAELNTSDLARSPDSHPV